MTRTLPDPREFRRRLRAREPLLGTFLKTPTSHHAEIFGSVGYDFVILDEEHAPWTRTSLDVGILGARAFGTAPLVRIARSDASSVLSVLDDGATGIMVPHVASAQKARDVVAWSRYRGGLRGAGLSRGSDHGARAGDEHLDHADEVVTVMAMIEDAEAIERAGEIAAVDGVDAIFLGRGDLAISLANAGPGAPTMKEAVETVCRAVMDSGKALSAVVGDIASDEAKWLRDCGVTAMMVQSDHGFLRNAALAALKTFEQEMKG
ncbi:HpcH/HpaI aldolase family protein [Tsuneonella sp. HG222]